nr:hypothetical protein [Tanacetum cinerariifolium]
SYYPTPKPHKPYAPTSKASISTRSYATTRNKGKEIAKPITPPSESAFDEDSDPEQARRDKDMQKKLALIAKYFKNIYKPTNNNLRTSSNSRNKNVDTSPRENIGSLIMQQTGIQCFNCKEFGHFAKKCRKPKRVKDYAYHKEKMLLYKQAETGTDSEPLEQVHYNDEYNAFANVNQHYEQSESTSNTCLVEKGDSVTPDSSDMCEHDIQTDQNVEDVCDALANLIANLKLNMDENKKIQKQLKKQKHHLLMNWNSANLFLQKLVRLWRSLIVFGIVS